MYQNEQKMLANNQKWLEHDEIGRKLLSEFRPMICYRRPRNLKEILTHADVYKKPSPKPGTGPCLKNCQNCQRMTRAKTVKSFSTDFKFVIRNNLDCRSHYVIYLIECCKCGIQYVGQTTNSIAMRLTAHMTDIKKNKNTTVARHFNMPNHSERDVKVYGLTRTSKDLNIRLRHEEAIIYLMSTASPSGMNVMT